MTLATDLQDSAGSFQPLLSVIVPVYNGQKKLEATLDKIQAKIDQLHDAMWAVELESTKVEYTLLKSGKLPELSDDLFRLVE